MLGGSQMKILRETFLPVFNLSDFFLGDADSLNHSLLCSLSSSQTVTSSCLVPKVK